MECERCGSGAFLARITEESTTIECSGCGAERDRWTHERLREDEENLPSERPAAA